MLLLQHNSTLAEEELCIVQDFRNRSKNHLDSIRQEISILEQEIERLQTRCTVLEAQIDPRKKEVFACDVALSPFRRLPFDILQEIAMWCLPEKPTGQIRDAPISLSQVSSGWRRAVLSMLSLWSELHIHLDTRLQEDQLIRFMTQYFGRAQGRPLSLTISVHSPKRFHLRLPALRYARQFMDWMFHRWPLISTVRHLSIASDYAWSDLLDIQHPAKMAMLESLVLKNSSPNCPAPRRLFAGMWLGKGLNQVSRLQRIKLDDSVLGDNPASLTIPWWQLTHIFLQETLPAPNWVLLLQKCTSLETGYFLVSDSFLHQSNGRQTEDHTTLRDLNVIFIETTPTSLQLLRHRCFPNVARLAITFLEDNELAEDLEQPFDLYSHYPSLSDLALFAPRECPLDVPLFLQHNPSLKTLRISIQVRHYKKFFRYLTLQSSSNHDDLESVLPQLSSLVVQISDENAATALTGRYRVHVATMIRSRISRAGNSERRIHLMMSVPDIVTNEFKETLDTFQKDGLTYRVDDYAPPLVPTIDTMDF
ncbi:hypothetical protein NLJ89_g11290 [Agrocybe chaxingu]|uniref:F-box domain-containing protein n=1 Tax=Agrocybe chaxingu TaxID=84603 RepID=A0A9W8MQ50_9AGAR|nr:hypothetical protein NLJ89_g11290 [Agrocybe chaxingu]